MRKVCNHEFEWVPIVPGQCGARRCKAEHMQWRLLSDCTHAFTMASSRTVPPSAFTTLAVRPKLSIQAVDVGSLGARDEKPFDIPFHSSYVSDVLSSYNKKKKLSVLRVCQVVVVSSFAVPVCQCGTKCLQLSKPSKPNLCAAGVPDAMNTAKAAHVCMNNATTKLH